MKSPDTEYSLSTFDRRVVDWSICSGFDNTETNSVISDADDDGDGWRNLLAMIE